MLRICLLNLICLSALCAHKINLFVYDEAGVLYIQSYFTKSSPCKQCPIRLLDANQKEIVSLTTNDEGKVSVKLPLVEFDIVAEGSMGHQAQTHYIAQTHVKEETKTLPSDTPLEKMVLGLAIMTFFFGVLFWIKRKRIRS